MPSSLRTRVRVVSAGATRTPRQYLLLAITAAVLVALVFFAVGQLVTNSIAAG